jgi:hypothetical protein
MDKVQDQIAAFKKRTKPGDKVEIEVARREKGVYKNKKLKGKAILVEKKKKFLVEFNDEATPRQLKIRKAWLGQ